MQRQTSAYISNPPSLVEQCLIRGGEDLIKQFFFCWEPQLIMRFGVINIQLRCIAKLYISRIWNVRSFLVRWFDDPDAATRALTYTKSLAFGPTIVRFFDRNTRRPEPLDLCVGYNGLWALGLFLMSAGYRFSPEEHDPNTFELAALEAPSSRQKIHLNPHVRAFRFIRPGISDDKRDVTIHLVRCEPYQYILTMHSSELTIPIGEHSLIFFSDSKAGLMNYISGTHAVSLFARSTFIHRRSLITNQHTQPDGRNQAVWINSYGGGHRKLALIGDTRFPLPDIELGNRFAGDALCWTIPAKILKRKSFTVSL